MIQERFQQVYHKEKPKVSITTTCILFSLEKMWGDAVV